MYPGSNQPHVRMGNGQQIFKLFDISVSVLTSIWIFVSVFELSVVVKWIHLNSIFIDFLHPIPHLYLTISDTSTLPCSAPSGGVV